MDLAFMLKTASLSFARRRSARFVAACLLALALTACSGVPDEAIAQHGKAVAALSAKNKDALRALVVPTQRTGPLGITGGLGGIKADKPTSKLTLDDVLDIEFFSDVKEVTVEEDLKTKMDDNTVWLGAMFTFGDGMFGARSLVFKNVNGVWLVDMKATLEKWSASGDGFTVFGLKK
jgi:hypothetical protein